MERWDPDLSPLQGLLTAEPSLQLFVFETGFLSVVLAALELIL